MRTRKSVAALGTLALCAGMAFGQPGRPAAPGTPGTPGAPGNPGSPGAPAAPGKPGAPATPGVPGTPGAEPVKAPKPEPGQIDLRPRFTLGRITRYQMDLVSNNKTKLGKDAAEELKDLDNQEQTMSQGLTLSLTVKEVSAEGATIELSYDRMKVAFKTADMDATFDSAQPRKAPPPSRTTKPRSTPGGSNPGTGTPPATPANLPGADGDPAELLAQIIKPMVGTKLTMKVDNNGNITSVSGGDALAGNGLSGLGGSLAGLGGGLGGLPGGLGNIPTPTAGGAGTPGAGPMNWMISGVAQRPFVRVGESWTNTDSLGNTPVGDFKMVTKHTCKSSSRGQANFSFSGRADQGSAGGSPNPTQMFQLKETTYSGDYAWDLERGELRNMNSTMTTSIDGRFMGSTITLNANTKVTVRQLN